MAAVGIFGVSAAVIWVLASCAVVWSAPTEPSPTPAVNNPTFEADSDPLVKKDLSKI